MFQRQVLHFLRLAGGRASLPVKSRSCSSEPTNQEPPLENESLLENLSILGVDLPSARRRQPGVLRKLLTNEQGLALFLKSKGADPETIASIISRFPRSITRSCEHLEERWRLWRDIFKSDAEVVGILSRSPESFFRSSDNKNLEENISFLRTLRITGKDLHRLLTTAPRTFSNSVELNRNMVEFLKSICVSFDGNEPERFARAVISRNLYVFIRSTNRIRANVDFLCRSLSLSNAEALGLFQSHGAQILDVSHESLKRNFQNLRTKLDTLGCDEADLKRMILNYSLVLFISSERLNEKLDCLMDGGILAQQIVCKPKVLDFSVACIRQRLNELNALGYDFQKSGIAVLDTSKKRFLAKLQRLSLAEV
ncbi:transcription termination factor 1, mitochondrial [Onychostoma macrolepis]|uniref:transcription termination factor 1, mitochondrial n=1 Tax=Onychostoma macrolepis TaxID=369639 RepID=UPI00272AFB91|nr:transcription termination factor 1, mitochondrial [Onychostoma macrolepis]XP_058609415.1 transcription termination factor 1, mitochondrial [Onychostoma macrolepis]